MSKRPSLMGEIVCLDDCGRSVFNDLLRGEPFFYAFDLLFDGVSFRCGMKAIWLTKAETARRVKQRIKTVFDWAKAAQHRTGDNPTEGLPKVLPKHNREAEHRAAVPYGEVPEFIHALRDASKISATVKLALGTDHPDEFANCRSALCEVERNRLQRKNVDHSRHARQ
jgi:hypothetical protein